MLYGKSQVCPLAIPCIYPMRSPLFLYYTMILFNGQHEQTLDFQGFVELSDGQKPLKIVVVSIKIVTHQAGIFSTLPGLITVEVRLFKSMISGYRLPLPSSFLEIPHRVSPLFTVYSVVSSGTDSVAL